MHLNFVNRLVNRQPMWPIPHCCVRNIMHIQKQQMRLWGFSFTINDRAFGHPSLLFNLGHISACFDHELILSSPNPLTKIYKWRHFWLFLVSLFFLGKEYIVKKSLARLSILWAEGEKSRGPHALHMYYVLSSDCALILTSLAWNAVYKILLFLSLFFIHWFCD